MKKLAKNTLVKIKNVDMFRFIGKIVLRSCNKEFQAHVLKFNFQDPQVTSATEQSEKVIHLPIHSYGEENPGKIIMYLRNQSYHAGFCALWVYFLNRLSFSDKMGFVHYIDWDQSDFYQEPNGIHGATSIFEYYFEQPCGISKKEVMNSKCVVYDYNCEEYGFYDFFRVGGEVDYKFSRADIKHFGNIQRKHIRLQPRVRKRLDAQIQHLLQEKKVLGVHARGGDTKIGYKGHPINITIEQYIQETKMAFKKAKAQNIFLATDDQDILDGFVKEFGDKVYYYTDVIRSTGNMMNCFQGGQRKKHQYLLGFEIIRDVYTLAQCDSFICGMSYVGFVVQILKESMNQKYKYFKRIFLGLQKEGIDLTNLGERNKIKKMWNKQIDNEKNIQEVVDKNA